MRFQLMFLVYFRKLFCELNPNVLTEYVAIIKSKTIDPFNSNIYISPFIYYTLYSTRLEIIELNI